MRVSLKNMTEEEKLEHKKRIRKEASKRYYESHKAYYKKYQKEYARRKKKNMAIELKQLKENNMSLQEELCKEWDKNTHYEYIIANIENYINKLNKPFYTKQTIKKDIKDILEDNYVDPSLDLEDTK